MSYKQFIVLQKDRLLRRKQNEQVALFNEDGTPFETGPSAGVPIVRKFPFEFDTPDILTGAEVYTPTVDDVLLDAWIEIVEAWNGTTPLCDVGAFAENTRGFWGSWDKAVELGFADDQSPNGLLNHATNHANGGSSSNLALSGATFVDGENNVVTLARVVPAKFIADHPIKVCVTTTGQNDGDDPEATQGSAILYLVTVTPV